MPVLQPEREVRRVGGIITPANRVYKGYITNKIAILGDLGNAINDKVGGLCVYSTKFVCGSAKCQELAINLNEGEYHRRHCDSQGICNLRRSLLALAT